MDIAWFSKDFLRAALIACAIITFVAMLIFHARMMRKIAIRGSIFSPVAALRELLRALKIPETYLFVATIFIGIAIVRLLKDHF